MSHQSPLCKCGCPLVTIAWSGRWDHARNDTDRLICCGCGESIYGTDEQYNQAKFADEEYDEKERPLDEGKLYVPPPEKKHVPDKNQLSLPL